MMRAIALPPSHVFRQTRRVRCAESYHTVSYAHTHPRRLSSIARHTTKLNSRQKTKNFHTGGRGSTTRWVYVAGTHTSMHIRVGSKSEIERERGVRRDAFVSVTPALLLLCTAVRLLCTCNRRKPVAGPSLEQRTVIIEGRQNAAAIPRTTLDQNSRFALTLSQSYITSEHNPEHARLIVDR